MTENFCAQNEHQLSVQRGQQVQLLDTVHLTPGSTGLVSDEGPTEWYLVRSTLDEVSEGLVPMAAVRQVSGGLKASGSRTSIGHDAGKAGQ